MNKRRKTILTIVAVVATAIVCGAVLGRLMLDMLI